MVMMAPAMTVVTKSPEPMSSPKMSSERPRGAPANEVKMSGEPLPNASTVTPARFSDSPSTLAITVSAAQKLQQTPKFREAKKKF